MISKINITVGKYILYELHSPVQSCELVFNQNVKTIKCYDQIRNCKLSISQESVERLLQNNSDLFVYFEGNVPLGMMCGHRGSCYIRGPGISLLHGEEAVYWFWGFTIPEARGKKVFKKLRESFFCYYGCTKKFTALVEPKNSIMRDEIRKLGFVEAKLYSYIKLGKASLVFEKCNTTQNKCIHFEYGNRHKLPFI